MSCCSKEKMERSDCVNSIKSHFARSEREMFRVCPSKLSKRELEDLYFTLLENNLELKKTINKQQDNIRVLSTQVQRMTNTQEKLVKKEIKECCTGTRAFVNEQKVFITELKDTNHRMAERIQHLNMRLSSAKQFHKTSIPQTAMARLNNPCRVASLTPKKHDCLRKSQEPRSPYEPLKLSTFSQWEVKSPQKATQTQNSVSNEKSPKSDKACDANKCRSLMDELKLEIVTLQEELSIVHYEYSTRISRLEAEVAEVRKENVRVSSERTASQHELQNTLKQNSDILARFRKSEAKCAELAAELLIEKRKVAELATLMKAANLSDRVNKTMEEHLISLTETLQGTVEAPKETDEKPPKRKCGCPPPRVTDGMATDKETLQGTVEAPKETDEKPPKCKCGCLPPKVTDGMATDKNWLPEISKQKEVEDSAGKSSPTKYIMPSKSTSSVSKSIKVELETPSKARSKEISSNTPSTAGATAAAEVTDCKNQEYPYPPPKDLSPRPEDRKNVSPRYAPPKDLSTRLEERKNQEYPNPPPKDPSTRPEDRKNQEYSNLPPKDLSPRPEDRKNLSPRYAPPKDLSTRLEDRKNQEYPNPPPKDSSARPEDRKNQEYPNPRPKDSSTRPEDRKNLGTPPYPPPKDSSTRLEDRKNPYPPPKDLSPQPEDRKNQEYPYTPPKDLSPRPEDRINLGYPPYPPPKDVSTGLEDRTMGVCCPNSPSVSTRPAECKCYTDIDPRPESHKCCNVAACSQAKTKTSRLIKGSVNKDAVCAPLATGTAECDCFPPPHTETAECDCFPPPQAKKEEVFCRCPAWVRLPKPPRQDRRTKCKLCCYPDPSKADNGKVNSPRGARARFSPTKEINKIKSKLESITTDDSHSHYESDEMALLKQNKQLLVKILELQNKVDSMKKGVSESPEGKLSRRTSMDSPRLFDQCAEDGLKRNKNCKKDKPGATESPPSKNDKGLSTRSAQTRFSPIKDKDDTKSTNTADDSGYQESDETGLLKMNKDLLLKISELQKQVGCMKIEVCRMSEAQSGNLGERQETPAKSTEPTATTAPVKSPPLLAELTKASESSETKRVSPANMLHTSSPLSLSSQSETERQIDKTWPFSCKPSDEVVNRPRQKLRIEVLGNPAQPKSSDETRAKTVQDCNGTLLISEDSDEYNIVNYDSKVEFKTPEVKITENKKLEVADSIQPDIVSIKPGIAPGFAFNPEKLKYFENEGIIAAADLHQAKLKEDSGSISEILPSNPELGFGILRLANKDKKAEIDSGQAKTSPAAGPSPQRVRNDKLEILPGKLKLPVCETLAANYPTAAEQTDETKKEDCEYCAACSFDKECELKHENALNATITELAHGMQKEQIESHELLDALKIPDAIPTSDNNKKDKKKNIFSHLMKDTDRKQKTRRFTKDEIFANVQKVLSQKSSITTGQPVNLADVPLLDQRENCTTNIFLQNQDSITDAKKTMLKKDKSVRKQKKEDDFNEGSKHTCDTAVGPIILPDGPLVENRENRKIINDTTTDNEKNNNQEIPMFEIETPTEDARRVEHTADVAQSPEHKLPEKASQAIITTTNKAEAPRVSSKELACQRDVSVYRRASGTICFRSVPVSHQPACDCPGAVDGYCTDHSKNKGVQKQGDRAQKLESLTDRHRESTAERGTYTVGSNRAETPDTDQEMSHLPDLPLENEKKSPGKLRPLSPGEDRTTTHTSTTQSDYSQSSTARYSLSEGEMPPTTKRRSSVFIDKTNLNPTVAQKLETPPTHQMEAALNAITEELQRCKILLQANRYDELPTHASQTPAPAEPRPIALKPAVATQGIGNAHTPMSVFTLHIGTVVLSDEAVLYSRSKNLVLKWKFYNQPVTMARMHTGRVVVYDFSTQYDIMVTEEFLKYLKHEVMPIIICELEREEQPFATANLPLRDALILANTRADKSVVLLAGPLLRAARTPGGVADAPRWSAELRDEVGVIDLWCMLSADTSSVSGGNLAIAQPGAALKTQQHRRAIQHDYNELDIGMDRSKVAASHEPTGKNLPYANVEYTRVSNPWKQELKSRTKQATGTDTTQAVSTATEQNTIDLSQYPPIRERAPVPGSTNTSELPPRFTPLLSSSIPSTSSEAVPDRNSSVPQASEMIFNEVNSSIKTSGDLALAAGRHRPSLSRSRVPKDDSLPEQRSSRGSLKSYLNQLHKRGSRVTLNIHGGESRNFIEKLRKASRTMKDGHVDRANHMEIYNKYENISKMGANRAEQSKKVTIQNERNADDMDIDQPQRQSTQKVDVTVLWLALNEECEAMLDPEIQRVYIAYTFLGRTGADLETPVSLPKPKHYVEKCYFNFKKTFELDETDILKIGHMSRCRSGSTVANEKDCIVFSVVSEPADDPLGIESCEDIGYAFLYLGDLLAYSAGSRGYTEVMPVRAAHGVATVCGVLAVRIDGLDVVRRCQQLTRSDLLRPS